MSKRILCIVALLCAFALPVTSFAQGKEKDKKEEAKPQSEYEKLFSDQKKMQVAKGPFTVRKVEDKIYFEIPQSFMGRQLMFKTSVEAVSDYSLSYANKSANNNTSFILSKTDSLVIFSLPTQIPLTDEEGMRNAIADANIKAIYCAFPIKAYSPNGDMVIDVTSIFTGGDKKFANLSFSSGMSSVSASYKNDLSFLMGIGATADEIMVKKCATYGCAASVMGFAGSEEKLTVHLNYRVCLLPESKMKPRLADSRIGVNYVIASKMMGSEQGTQNLFYATRWNLNKDSKIEFYVDTLFTPTYFKAIKDGIEEWNKAFNAIGFNNPIEVKSYPKDDWFSANSGRYNIVKFVQANARKLSYSLSYDPTTGEISHAEISVCPEYQENLQREVTLGLAAVEPEVRTVVLPNEHVYNAVKIDFMEVMGIVLGLVQNNAGSTSYTPESLRTPSFTKENGLSTTVMGGNKYNVLAQPGDKEKGVELYQKGLGVYDYYVIKWLYSLEADENPALLDQWIVEHQKDPRYTYCRTEVLDMAFDPRSMVNTSSDPVESMDCILNNTKFLVDHAHEWVFDERVGDVYTQLFIDFIFLKAYVAASCPIYYIGGAYVTEHYVGDTNPIYIPLERATQERILKKLLNTSLNLSWLNDNKKLMQESGSVSRIDEYMYMNICGYIWRRISDIPTSMNPEFSYKDALGMVVDHLCDQVISGKEISVGNKILLGIIAKRLDKMVGDVVSPKDSKSLNDVNETAFNYDFLLTGEAYSPVSASPLNRSGVKYYASPNNDSFNYLQLKKLGKALRKGASRAKNTSIASYYQKMYSSLENL